MNRIIFVFAILTASTTALAQEMYKCTIAGSTVIQDRPCPGAVRRSADMPAKPAVQTTAPPQVTAAALSPTEAGKVPSDVERQKAFMAKGAKERRLTDLQYEISRVETAIQQSQINMNAEIAALDHKKSSANNNLAGATYLNSLATEQQAISTRYGIEVSTLRDRLKQLQDQLAAEQKKP